MDLARTLRSLAERLIPATTPTRADIMRTNLSAFIESAEDLRVPSQTLGDSVAEFLWCAAWIGTGSRQAVASFVDGETTADPALLADSVIAEFELMRVAR